MFYLSSVLGGHPTCKRYLVNTPQPTSFSSSRVWQNVSDWNLGNSEKRKNFERFFPQRNQFYIPSLFMKQPYCEIKFIFMSLKTFQSNDHHITLLWTNLSYLETTTIPSFCSPGSPTRNPFRYQYEKLIVDISTLLNKNRYRYGHFWKTILISIFHSWGYLYRYKIDKAIFENVYIDIELIWIWHIKKGYNKHILNNIKKYSFRRGKYVS